MLCKNDYNGKHSKRVTDFSRFQVSGIPFCPSSGTENILGVRIPQLRVMAKEIAKRDDWRIFIEATDTKFYEEAMLQGMVIGRSKTALDEQMKYVKRFVPASIIGQFVTYFAAS
ncbi:hypothetical protein BFINE_31170 [Bacteroides finegoldii DSM 17565]|nr:hypothetical protein BFINE_31170 [Bacteroides finegoldii DSM 17565]